MKGADSRRDFYEAWFLAYKAAKRFQCLRPLVQRQSDMYTVWGNVNVSFDRWWERKQKLFTLAMEKAPAAGARVLRVPIGQKIGPLLRDIRRLLRPLLFNKRDSTVLRDDLLFYVGYYLPRSKTAPQRTGVSEVPDVRAYFKKIGRTQPTSLQGSEVSAARSLNRSLHRAEAAIIAVAAGTFPNAPKNAKRLFRQMDDELLEQRIRREPVLAGLLISYRRNSRKVHKRQVLGHK